MSNVVAFKPDQRGKAVVDHGADMGRILFFTGVRYFRDEAVTGSQLDVEPALCETEAAVAEAATERLKA